MKIKRKQFIQHISHDIANEDKAWNSIDESLPNIGRIVMFFNSLEKLLDQMLCEIFTDRTDSTGLIVIQHMQYSSKVNLFGRFSDELHMAFGSVPKPYVKLLDKLKEAAKQRNTVVHADWENTDEHGYTFSNIRISNGEKQQEYVQLTAPILEEISDNILAARRQLGEYWDSKEELIQRPSA